MTVEFIKPIPRAEYERRYGNRRPGDCPVMIPKDIYDKLPPSAQAMARGDMFGAAMLMGQKPKQNNKGFRGFDRRGRAVMR